LGGDNGVVQGLLAAVTVLVIACPSALGGTAINMVALAGVSMAVAGIAALLVIKE
jgi:cation transport ATPase